jgi:hypothetical protein
MREILMDYEVVHNNITRLLKDPRQNFIIIHPHYIYPSVMAKTVPMNDKNGEYQYYLELRGALEEALATGGIQKEILPDHSPKYLSDLVRR